MASPDNTVLGEFLARATDPTQSQINALIGPHGIPIMALAHDAPGVGFAVGMIKVDRQGGTFEFTDDADVKPVVGLVTHDWDGEVHDVVGWSPRDGWTGTWLARAVVAHEFELAQPQLGPLPVHLSILDWLRAERRGVAVVDRERVWRALEGFELQAATIEDGVALRRLMDRPRAKIVVPERALVRRAA